ncbi:hypothetical protein HQ487_05420 [Candidatus Uhrbacteria bacterium]|nr:hypothetical protein [Candidatus Uhrbacteria bacterium]
MNIFFLLALIFSTSAFAGDLLTPEQIREGCEAQARVSVGDCVSAVRLYQAEQQAQQAELRTKELEAQVARIAERPAPAPTVVSQPAAQVVTPVMNTGGVASFTVVPEPALMSIHKGIESVDPDTMLLTGFRQEGSRVRCGGQGATMVLLTNHGVPMRDVYVPSAGVPSGFREVYYDADGDGQPDGGTVFALDLATQDSVYVSWGQNEDIKVVYLRESGKVAVPGLPLQTFYRPTRTSDNPGSGAIACDMDSHDPKSGHRTKGVYSMSRAW